MDLHCLALQPVRDMDTKKHEKSSLNLYFTDI